MLTIIPSILTNNLEELRSLIEQSEGVVKRVHIDIIDGVFVNNKTIFPEVVSEIQTDLLFDYHLMVKKPINWVEKSIRGYADRIIGQIEMMSSQQDFVNNIVSKGYKAGLAIDLETDVDELDTSVLGEVAVVLVMSVHAGFGGQEFNKESLDKIVRLDRIRSDNDFKFTICDDGGVSLESVDDAHYYGADEISVGRSIFAGDLKTNVEKLQKSAHNVKLME